MNKSSALIPIGTEYIRANQMFSKFDMRFESSTVDIIKNIFTLPSIHVMCYLGLFLFPLAVSCYCFVLYPHCPQPHLPIFPLMFIGPGKSCALVTSVCGLIMSGMVSLYHQHNLVSWHENLA